MDGWIGRQDCQVTAVTSVYDSQQELIRVFVNLGYVLDCLPSASEGWKSYRDQLHFLWDLEMKPDYIINLKVCYFNDYMIITCHKIHSANPGRNLEP